MLIQDKRFFVYIVKLHKKLAVKISFIQVKFKSWLVFIPEFVLIVSNNLPRSCNWTYNNMVQEMVCLKNTYAIWRCYQDKFCAWELLYSFLRRRSLCLPCYLSSKWLRLFFAVGIARVKVHIQKTKTSKSNEKTNKEKTLGAYHKVH